MRMSRSWVICASALAVLVSALFLAACGSSSSSSSSSTASGDEQSGAAESSTVASDEGAAGSGSETTYQGPEDKWLKRYATPQKKAGTNFKVGYLQVIGSLPLLKTMENGAVGIIEELGGTVISSDAELDIEKQVAGFDQMLAQGVDAIVGYPVVAKALAPELAKAEAAGIPVITVGSQADVEKPLVPGILSDVQEAFDFESYETMKHLSEEHPGASFTVMGLAIPVESQEYSVSRLIHWGKHFGLKFEGEVDTQEDNPEGYSVAATAILGKYPNTEVIACYNELAALTTATTAQAAGKSEVLITANNGGSEQGIEAVKAGRLFSTYALPWREIGEEAARGAYDAVSEQGVPLPERVSLRGTLVTAANVDEVEPTVEGG